MAKIVFAPVCSKCEQIIKKRVDCKYDDTDDINPRTLFKDKVIEPERCPNCGVYFDAILMPMQLPSQLFD